MLLAPLNEFSKGKWCTWLKCNKLKEDFDYFINEVDVK